MRSIIILLAVLLVPIALMAQFNEAWVATYNGPNSQHLEQGNAVTVDGSGNTYIAGYCDFGLGTGADMITIKYNSLGETLWVATYNGPENSTDYATDVEVDASGNVYVCGTSWALSSLYDFLLIKYNSTTGETIWTRRNCGITEGLYQNFNDVPYRMTIDASGNIILTGYSTYTYSPTTYWEGWTVKYNSNGTLLWKRQIYESGGISCLVDVTTDASGNVYAAGWRGYPRWPNYSYWGPVVVKYSADGTQRWRLFVQGQRANAVGVDSEGNVYITGTGNGNFQTNSYDSLGVQRWVNYYNGPGSGDDEAFAMKVDANGNVFVTGKSTGSGTGYDYATVKYNTSGVQQWVSRYSGSGSGEDGATAMEFDASGNVLITGYMTNSGTGRDYTTIRYNPSTGNQDWIVSYNGPANLTDQAYGIAITTSSNILVTGGSRGIGTLDDIATVMYNSSGVQQWASRFTIKRSCDIGRRVTYDTAGNVYVTGHVTDTMGMTDYVTIKYNSAGVQQWLATYNGIGNNHDRAFAIGVDASGNVYVTGESYTGGYASYDYATVKYNSSGVEQWVARYHGGMNYGNDYAVALTLDASGNIYILGSSQVSGPNFLTIKYNPNGDLLWTQRSNQIITKPTDIAVDGSGNVYVTGNYRVGAGWPRSYYLTIKYNTSGVKQWEASYHYWGQDTSRAIAVDASGNVYVTGMSQSWENITGYDFATVKYNSNGLQQWVKFYDGPSSSTDDAYDVTIDASGNILVTGASTGSGSGFDYATVKYDSSGAQLWESRYNGPGNAADQANAIAVDALNNIYVTGQSTGSGTNLDYATVKYDSCGNQLACQRHNGPDNLADYSVSIAADAMGNAFITGYSSTLERDFDIVTIKYQSLTPPDAPVLVSPTNEATNQPIAGTLTWNEAARATGYDVYLDVNNPPTNIVSTNQPGLTYAYSDLLNNTVYYWKVVAKNAAGGTSSEVWSFTSIIAAPGEFNLSTPLDDAINVAIEGDLTWQASERTTSYEVTLGSNTYTVTTNSYHYSGLNYYTDYTWNVTAINVGGETNATNGPFSFTTIIEKPAAFNLTLPLDDAIDVLTEDDLTWQASERADYYEVTLGSNTYTVTTNYYHYSGLSYLTDYEWNVTAYNVGGNTVTTNGPFNFTTIIQVPEPPELVSPDNGAITQLLSGTLTWNPALRADNYDVYFGTDNPPMIKISENQITTTYNYSVLLNEQTHYWQIVAKNQGGSTPSSIWSFTTGRLDVGVVEITEPSGIIDTLPETPEATVKNFGTLPADFSVCYIIRDSATNSIVYTGTITVLNLLPGDPLSIEFPVWNRPTVEGCYYSQCYTQLTNDANPSNDLTNSQFAVEGKSQQPANWTQRMSVPTGSQNRTIMHGACLATDQQGLFIYLLKGNNTGEFYQYNPGNNAWTMLDAIPSLVKEGGTLTQVDGKFYTTTGGNTVEFWEYDPNGSPKWTQKANVPADVHSGASSAGVMINGNSYVYLLRASVSFDFFRYNVSTNIWETMASAPYVEGEEFKKGSSISYDGTDTIYVLKGIFNNFYAYVVSTNTWLTRPSLPLGSNNKAAKGGADILYHMRKVYCIKGSNSQEFWVYQCSTGVWIQDSDVLLGADRKRVDDGGSMVYSYYYRYLYITKGHSLEFLSYGQLSNYAGINQNPKMNDNTQNSQNEIVNNYELKALPNICHDFARITYGLPKSSNVILKLYDATGREIRNLAQGTHEPGRYNINLNVHTLAQGIYYLKYESGTYHDIKKLIVQQ